MPPPAPQTAKGLTITNPLILYRALLATQRIQPDESQHRLAIHLQKLYHRLKDYSPALDYSHRLKQISSTLSHHPPSDDGSSSANVSSPLPSSSSLFTRLTTNSSPSSTALTRSLTSSEAAVSMTSPRGLLLHGEVGTGKSMLVDILADSLPNSKKRRWHFSAFMLDTFSRLEKLRQERKRASLLLRTERAEPADQAASVVLLARDLIHSSPIIFLDEFQLPDRASAKILSGLFTAFFQLGGVLVATSNRMPEELAKAAGVEFAQPPRGIGTGLGRLRDFLGLRGKEGGGNMFSGNSDFVRFLDVLRARCEVWEMRGGRDWRRVEGEMKRGGKKGAEGAVVGGGLEGDVEGGRVEGVGAVEEGEYLPPKYHISASGAPANVEIWSEDIQSALSSTSTSQSLDTIAWIPHTMHIYARPFTLPRTYEGIAYCDFSSLCATNLGPADYITLASTFNTLILTDVPILTLLQKNEARRFITLLDALYESRCRLLIRAEAGPDNIFFPEVSQPSASRPSASSSRPGLSSPRNPTGGKIPAHPSSSDASEDATYAESFSDMYQDMTSPFRPNISSYDPPASSPSYRASSPPSHPSTSPHFSPNQAGPHTSPRSILADEDADFGPVYGAGRGHGASSGSNTPVPSTTQRDGEPDPRPQGQTRQGVDFQNTSQFTGADERFAFARARSRLWEMCGEGWWKAREGDSSEWWRPVGREARGWEGSLQADDGMAGRMVGEGMDGTSEGVGVEVVEGLKDGVEKDGKGPFPHGATSPFRTSVEDPPKIGWQHAWGMVSWGKRAGDWGKGAEGLGRRAEEKREEEKVEVGVGGERKR
ncbi:MAG: hypothetical protein MMC23_000656 [Stictis urceolatum]|nr:hypothetical protein [Stictis urceolata]